MLCWVFVVLAALGGAEAAQDGGIGWFRNDYYSTVSFWMSLGMEIPPPRPPPPCRQYFCLNKPAVADAPVITGEGQGPFEFEIDPLITKNDIRWPTIGNYEFKSGPYKPGASQAMKYLREIGGENGSFAATDNARIREGTVIRNLEIHVMNFSEPNRNGFVGLAPGSKNEQSFIDVLFTGLSERMLVFQTKWALGYPRYLYKGSVTFGHATPSVCSIYGWTVIPSDPAGSIVFTLESEKVQIGDAVNQNRSRVAFSKNRAELDQESYAAAITELGVDSDGSIDCTQSKEITVAARGFRWILKPEDYIDTSAPKCRFVLKESADNVIVLPMKVLTGFCLRYDYKYQTMSFSKSL